MTGNMKSFLVIGVGRFGRHVCKKLFELGYDVMAVDRNEECIERVLPYTVNSIIGDSTNGDFIKSIGVGNFDTCFVAIGDDFQTSLETTSLLSECGAKYVVSRASRDMQAKFLLRNGADEVVYPERQLAEWSAIRYSSNNISNYIELPGDNSIFEFKVPKDWIGKSILELEIRKKYNLNIMAIKLDGNWNMRINPSIIFEDEQSILVYGENKDLEKFFEVESRNLNNGGKDRG